MKKLLTVVAVTCFLSTCWVNPVSAQPALSEERLVYTKYVGNDLEIFFSRPDGSKVQQVTNNTVTYSYAELSSDGTKLLITRTDVNNTVLACDLWIKDLTTGEEKKVIDTISTNGNPFWHPDGTRVYYFQESALMELNLSTGEQKRLADYTNSADISPDGKEIAYIKNSSTGPFIYKLNLETGYKTYLGMGGRHIEWSPTGDKLAYEGYNSIYTINPDGTGRTQIPVNMSVQTFKWSPDGTKIAFGQNRTVHVLDMITKEVSPLLAEVWYFTDWSQVPVVLKRLYGANRYEVSTNISKELSNLNITSDTVVIARGDLYTDALSGGPMAGQLKSPILLTATSSLPTAIKGEIQRRQPAKAIILGGTASVSTTVETQLKDLGVTNIERIDGPNRFAVSASVAEKVIAPGATDTAIIASGLNFPDALSASSIAAQKECRSCW